MNGSGSLRREGLHQSVVGLNAGTQEGCGMDGWMWYCTCTGLVGGGE